VRRAAIASNGRLQNVSRPILDCATSAILRRRIPFWRPILPRSNVSGFHERLVRVPQQGHYRLRKVSTLFPWTEVRCQTAWPRFKVGLIAVVA